MKRSCAILCHLWPVSIHHTFLILSQERHDCREKVISRIMCALILSTNFVWNISHSTKKSAEYYHNLHMSSCKVLILIDFNKPWIFSTECRKILKCLVSWKSVQWQPSYSMRTDRQTDMHDDANSCFSQHCEGACKAVRNSFLWTWKVHYSAHKTFIGLLLTLWAYILHTKASNKSTPPPPSLPQGYAEISTLGHVGGGNNCGGNTL
jgi:hypothetical protein